MNLLPFLAGVCMLIALTFLWIARRRQKLAGVPTGRVIYVDTSAWGSVEQPLFDPVLQLVGKPDYLVESAGGVLPVEVKSSHPVDTPYDSHVYQLIAYCRLVETVYQRRPKYGILKYPQKTFAIDYTKNSEEALITILDLMKKDQYKIEKKNQEVNRSHESAARCKGCGYRELCPQSLAG